MRIRSQSDHDLRGAASTLSVAVVARVTVILLALTACAAEPRDPKSGEPKADAKQPSPRPATGRMSDPLLEELLRQSGLSDDQFRTLTGQWPNDDALKELMAERERILRELRGLLGGPAGARGAFPNSSVAPRRSEGRLGVGVMPPGATLAEQLDLPKGCGLAVEVVRPESAAARAGVRAHDILLELDGQPVSSDLIEFQRQLAAIPGDKPIDALILRRGRRETLKGLRLPAFPANDLRRMTGGDS